MDSLGGNDRQPTTLQRYSYALNTPVDRGDPTGNDSVSEPSYFLGLQIPTASAAQTKASNAGVTHAGYPTYDVAVQQVLALAFTASLATSATMVSDLPPDRVPVVPGTPSEYGGFIFYDPPTGWNYTIATSRLATTTGTSLVTALNAVPGDDQIFAEFHTHPAAQVEEAPGSTGISFFRTLSPNQFSCDDQNSLYYLGGILGPPFAPYTSWVRSPDRTLSWTYGLPPDPITALPPQPCVNCMPFPPAH